MDFRQLTEADCGQGNPLLQLTSHLTRDHAFHDNHAASTSIATNSDQLVEQFLQETRIMPQNFRMDDLMREMNEIEAQRAIAPPVPASGIKDHLKNDPWALEYANGGPLSDIIQTNPEITWKQIAAKDHENLDIDTPIDTQIDWAAQYQHLADCEEENMVVQQRANELLDSVDDTKFANSKFMRFIKQVGDGNMQLDNIMNDKQSKLWAEEYFDEATGDSSSLAQLWADEHIATTNDDDEYNSQYWSNLQEQWRKLAERDQSDDHPWLSEYDLHDPYKEYEFSEENPTLDSENPLEKGKELLERGDLPGAVICFEAAVKREQNNAEAWQLLGTTQAENEQDPNAICALKMCLQLQPGNLTALMALAVSYTNENYFKQACQALVSWLKHHPVYKDIVPPDFELSGQVASLLDTDQQREVQELFIKAAQQNPLDPDYEIQCGLGVLFNLSTEYEKAADCFRVALGIRPDDARLWNRLGATLANGCKPEEAVEAYRHALNLAPGFIRARYNVGITCINLRAYKEAAEHFLTALNQQFGNRDVSYKGNNSQVSESIWSTLKLCITLLNKPDLKCHVENRDLKALNEAFQIHDV